MDGIRKFQFGNCPTVVYFWAEVHKLSSQNIFSVYTIRNAVLSITHSDNNPFNSAIKWAHFVDCNACTVDWSRLSRYNYSTAATKHPRIVSAATVNFMKFLTPYGLNVQQVSIAGFSLGAHIAGFIGASFPQQKLAAIYGTAISKDTHFCLNFFRSI